MQSLNCSGQISLLSILNKYKQIAGFRLFQHTTLEVELVGGNSLSGTDVSRHTWIKCNLHSWLGAHAHIHGRRLPQKDMMWLLSACTNFLVTASSMICFTWKTKVNGARLSLCDSVTCGGNKWIRQQLYSEGFPRAKESTHQRMK